MKAQYLKPGMLIRTGEGVERVTAVFFPSYLPDRVSISTPLSDSLYDKEDEVVMVSSVAPHASMAKIPPTKLFFANCRYSFALSLTLTGCMTLDNAAGDRCASFFGYFKPADRKGIGLCLWPLVLWLIWDPKSA